MRTNLEKRAARGLRPVISAAAASNPVAFIGCEVVFNRGRSAICSRTVLSRVLVVSAP